MLRLGKLHVDRCKLGVTERAYGYRVLVVRNLSHLAFAQVDQVCLCNARAKGKRTGALFCV